MLTRPTALPAFRPRPRQVVRIVQSAGSPQEAANLLTHSAFVAGSLDNVTAIVVALRGYRPGESAARSLVEPMASAHPHAQVKTNCPTW